VSHPHPIEKAPSPAPGLPEQRLRDYGLSLGFSQVGIAAPGPSLTGGAYDAWLDAGYAGEMAYLHRHAPLKAHPAALLPEAASLVLVALPYHSPEPAPPPPGEARLHGRVSRYAWGREYHTVMREKLAQVAAFLEREAGRPLRCRPFVDSAPVLEREWAARAGLGWVGRNANLIHPRLGSWFFLGGLLVDLPLTPDVPEPPRPESPPSRLAGAVAHGPLHMRELCGTCTACLRACPTGAIVADRTVDARRCISYLTIELKGAVPAPLRPLLGDWVFGCDVCQTVCPWNSGAEAPHTPTDANVLPAPPGAGPHSASERAWPRLAHWLGLDEAGFRRAFRETPLARPRRRGLLRNAALALGNQASGLAQAAPEARAAFLSEAVPALRGALRDEEPLVRGAAAWALGRFSGGEGRADLRAALAQESHPEVLSEIQAALAAAPGEDPSPGASE